MNPTPSADGAASSPNLSAPVSQSQRVWHVGTLNYTRIGLGTVFGWLLLGDFACSMKDRMVWPLVPLLLKNFDASDWLIGLIIGTIPAAIGLFLGPVISYRSDRKRGRWGRRIPYLLVTTPIAALAIISCAFSGVFGRWTHEFWGVGAPDVKLLSLLYFGISWTVFEFATVTSNAVFGGLINDVVPGGLLGRFFGLFRAVSLIAGIVFNLWLLDLAERYYMQAFTAVGLLYGLGFMAMSLRVKEGSYPPVSEAERPPGAALTGAAQIYFRECFGNSYYWWLFAFLTLGPLAFAPFNTFSVLYAKSLGVEMGLYGRYLAITFGISLALTYFIGAAVDRFHPLRLTIVALLAHLALSLWGGVAIIDGEKFKVIFICQGVVAGMFFTATASLAQRLLPRERFAQFVSAWGIIAAVANMVVPPLVGRILDLTGHDYRYTFLMGATIAMCAIAVSCVVHRKFMALGGPLSYVAPL